MWLDALKEAKKNKGLSSKQIAAETKLPERTVVRIFSGDTPNPYMDTLHRIAVTLDISLDELFGDSKAVVGTQNMAALQAEVDTLTADLERIRAELDLIKAEKSILDTKLVTLQAENDILRVKLDLKDEIIAVHNYYIKRG